MPDIVNAVSFDLGQQQLIKSKLTDPNFTHLDWSKDDLLGLRKHIRNHYRAEQKGLCYFCRAPISLKAASNSHVEHLVPKSKKLKFIFHPKNLCTICADCNEIKRSQEIESLVENTLEKDCSKYPEKSNSFKIVHPHFDTYEDNIFKCGDLFIDISKKGSFTIHICNLNRKAHKFGIEPSILSEEELRSLMLAWMAEKNFGRQQLIFNRLREFFIKIS